MGQLVEQPIKTLFNGVSRQPHPVRLPSQVEVADNVLFSVITGGFEKRPATQHVKTLTTLDSTIEYALHVIDRDSTERYAVVVGDDDLVVFDLLTGAAKTVAYPDGKTYLAGDPHDIVCVTVADYTFVVNRSVTAAMSSARFGRTLTPQTVSSITRASTTATVTTGVAHSLTTGDWVTVSGCTQTAYNGVFQITVTGATTFTYTVTGSPATPATGTPAYTAVKGAVDGTKQTFSALPAASGSLVIYKVTGNEDTEFDEYYVQDQAGSVWKEVAAPGTAYQFDATTMPHQLVRNNDGTFTFQKATWTVRPVGDDISVPEPAFIGKEIVDVFFHRGRLGLAADEFVTFSQAGDVFTIWPDKAFQEIDSDPVELQASTNKVTILRYGIPFRKALFLTADSVQFEIGSTERFTPKTAAMDVTTSYQVDPYARPVTMGEQLYFAGSVQESGVVYEYFYNGDTFSNVAADVTKHCFGYVPPRIRCMTASPLAGRLFVVPDDERNSVYVYTSYWDGDKKVQSAWGRYKLAENDTAAYVYGASVVGDFMYLLIARGTEVCLEKLPVETETADAGLGFAPLYDRRESLTGVYDAGNDWTTWTTSYAHGDAAAVLLSGDFTGNAGRVLSVTYPSGTTVRASGDFSGGSAYVGSPYEARCELSKQYLRDQNGSAIKTGRLQLRHFTFNYKNTGYFEVHVTAEARDPKVWTMTGRILGSSLNLIGTPSVVPQGNYRVRVGSRGDTSKVEVVSSSPYPFVITGASWVGFYNNVAQQPQG